MVRLKKDVAYPKKVWPPDRKSPVDLAPLIPLLAKRQQKFKEAGLNIPLVWKHDEAAVPEKELKPGDGRLTLGSVEGGEIDGDGVLLNDLEVADEKHLPLLKANRYVSPWIKWNWRDGNGKVWEGPSILHVAVTPRPVQTPQRSFQLSHDGQPEELSLWLADYEREEPAMDEKEKKGKKEKEIKPGDGFGPDILKALEGYGIHLPPDTDEKNIWERLRIICHAKSNDGEGGGDNNPSGAGGAGGGGKPVEVSEPNSPVGLGHKPPEKKPDPPAVNKAEQRLLKKEKDNLTAEIELAFKEGRCNGEMRKEVEEEIKSLKLSFDDNGELLPNGVLSTLKVWKRIPEGTYWTPEQKSLKLSQPTEVADPEGGDQLDDHVMSRLTGGRFKKRS